MKEDKKLILLVEDDFNLGLLIQDSLSLEGLKVHLCRDGKEALAQYNKHDYDLCILDVMLPHKDGFSLAEDIKKLNPTMPIIFLTAKSLPEDKITGLKIGADDYITKPFEQEEFALRVKAVLRRTSDLVDTEKELLYELGKLTFDPFSFELKKKTDLIKQMTKKEGLIMKLLCEHKDQTIERNVILNAVWGDDSYFNGRSLDVFMSKIRKYLSEDPKIEVKNIHGIGYRLEVM